MTDTAIVGNFASWLKERKGKELLSILAKSLGRNATQEYEILIDSARGFNAMSKPARNAISHEYLFQTQSLYK